jgi:hypothetical protein
MTRFPGLGLALVLALGAQRTSNELKKGPAAGTGELQARLDAGGTIDLRDGAAYESEGFVIRRSGTVLRGHGASLAGTARSAIYIPPGVNDVSISDVTVTATWLNAVVTCGDNSPATQSSAAQVPQRITFTNVVIPTHRGKRGFEINCAATLVNSKALDIWAPTLQDSQGIAVLNTCGPVTVRGGEYVAASENIMIGGDTLKVQGCIQSDVTVEGVDLHKPDSWRTDGTKRAVKNLFEVKSGRRVKLVDSTLSGSWRASQDGWAIVITPKNGNYIEDVLIDNVTVTNVGGGIQLLGKDNNSTTPQATSGVVVKNSRFTISKADYGGRGVLALLVGGMKDVTWDHVVATHDGTAMVVVDAQVPSGPWTMRASEVNTGAYGIQAPGANFGVPGYAGRELEARMEGNVFTLTGMSSAGKKAFKANFPNNTFK